MDLKDHRASAEVVSCCLTIALGVLAGVVMTPDA